MLHANQESPNNSDEAVDSLSKYLNVKQNTSIII